eukprot:TRINITY_DN20267_c0_g1_i1.p1 TRINITY_DN20267_c0_g1~~TRINITY_DN20267_c0_g1_i1.p1  ORF type:complete len:978 (+),score=208.74 TRINITY_DN20267_c0_g1_i1:761-3694(+)
MLEDLERQKKCEDLEQYCIYEGTVVSVKDFGAFIALNHTIPEKWPVRGKREGLCHISNISTRSGTTSCRDILHRGDVVFVKIMAKTENKISLSMNEVNQETGEDLRKRVAKTYEQTLKMQGDSTTENISGHTLKDDSDFNKKRRKPTIATLTGHELWERATLQRVGAFDGEAIADDPLYDQQRGVQLDLNEADNLDYTVEVNNARPAFIGSHKQQKALSSPVKLTRGSDSMLMKAAEAGRSFAKERQQLRDDEFRAQHQRGARSRQDAWEDTNTLQEDLEIQNEKILEWKKKAFGAAPTFGKISTMSIMEQRQELPIFKLRDTLIETVKTNQTLVVIGETGSGKTTQMTQYLVEAGFAEKGKRIGCTQPRRVAATSVAKRVSEEYGCKLGDEVGYAIRFDDMTSPATKIKYMTDGMLLRESLTDPNLENYSVIMLDEAHERTVNTDVLFGLMKKVLSRRADIHLIVTSATLDAEKFSTYFNNAPILTIPGRTHPVQVLYALDDKSDYLDEALQTAMQIHLEEPPGDILIFLTGQEEIDTAGEMLHEYMKKLGPKVPEMRILPVYAQQPSEMQSRIFEPAPPGTRKVVIATNIAEASITIDGIYYVIDPGLSKQKRYNPKLGMDSLDVAPISQASAKQRAGRAGRTGPGKCFRLYTEHEFKTNMLPMTVPEIQRTNLANTVLTLKAMGIHDLLTFPFMDAPPQETIVTAMETLYALGALDDEGMLTRVGRRMSEFPLEPPLSKVLITAVDFGCADDIVTIVAMLSVQNIFYRPKEKQNQADQKKSKFHQPEGDHITLLNIYESWKNNRFSIPWCVDNFLQGRSLRRAQDVRKQLTLLLEKQRFPIKSAGKNYTAIMKAITSGFFFHAAKRDSTNGYRTVAEDQSVYIHPSSALFQKNPEWVIYHDLVLTSKEYMREIMAIEAHWLPELAPRFFSIHDASTVSKSRQREKIQPLFNKYEAPDEWRLSKALKAAAKSKRR